MMRLEVVLSNCGVCFSNVNKMMMKFDMYDFCDFGFCLFCEWNRKGRELTTDDGRWRRKLSHICKLIRSIYIIKMIAMYTSQKYDVFWVFYICDVMCSWKIPFKCFSHRSLYQLSEIFLLELLFYPQIFILKPIFSSNNDFFYFKNHVIVKKTRFYRKMVGVNFWESNIPIDLFLQEYLPFIIFWLLLVISVLKRWRNEYFK